MLKIQMIFPVISFVIFLTIVSLCSAQGKYRSGGLYYYESFASHEIPFRPTGELSPEEAKSRNSYYVALYNDEGKIVSFTKYLEGKVEFSDKYIYSQTGFLERRELTKLTGEIVIQYFDKKGKIIQK